jgi:hypothetical protein
VSEFQVLNVFKISVITSLHFGLKVTINLPISQHSSLQK